DLVTAPTLSPPPESSSRPVDPVAWDVAEKVAIRVGGRDPLEESYLYASLEPDFREFTAQAEELVERETGLRSLAGPARAQVTDRAGWVRANVASFGRLLRPLTDRLGERLGTGRVASVGRQVAGAEVGALLGWMSTRVLGQYDLLVIENEEPEKQDIVYYVGPNILSLEKQYAFPPREFRLWLALHEVTHRAQFTGVPWMRDYFLSLVEAGLNAFDPDPKRFVDALRRAAGEVRAGRNPLDEGGLVSLFATPEQSAVFRKIQGLMSLLEGHGDIVMDRAGAELIPSGPRFKQVLHHRRQASGPAKILQKLIGLEAKLRQYHEGETFLEAIEKADPEAINRLWRGPEWLPTIEEIRNPDLWLARSRPPEEPELPEAAAR
ncbi:MAG TPA: zinc-dependent metalloprotease, partial [Actinomycetes bacterium]|nr:zinc-dependent metalloprotease [Actinomycetes bacterium]